MKNKYKVSVQAPRPFVRTSREAHKNGTSVVTERRVNAVGVKLPVRVTKTPKKSDA